MASETNVSSRAHFSCRAELVPGDFSYYGNRAAALMMLKKHKEALQDVERALELNPKFVKVQP